ncbi:MAG: protein translocase subunit SecD [Chloroflexi bacterium]|nr:protein translocase subunit SecD [Chloroflexota bacterium]MCI0816754.1 protein translocase subunit SecD [Chloroflexota bacterium]
MRHRSTLPLLIGITILSIVSIMVVWPGYPQKYLPDWIDYPEGPLTEAEPFDSVLGWIVKTDNEAMSLGLDLEGGTYVLTEADVSALPAGTDVDAAMDAAKDVIEDRINRFGVSETEVTREGKNRLAIQLPGVTPEEAEDLIGRTALLRFMEAEEDEAGLIVCRTADGERFSAEYPSQVIVGLCTTPELTGEVVWKPATGVRNDEVRALTGRQVTAGSAQATFDATGNVVVAIEFTGEGTLLFEQITARLSSPPRPLGIFLDDDLISAPQVSFVITQNVTTITGIGTLDDAKNLAVLLNSGALPVPLRTIQTTEVDATLGEETLVRGVQAGIIGILAVMLFMVIYYRLPGVLSVFALITYLAVLMTIFKLGPIIGPVTITLSGIAGIVLSVGMAVDANILVFERIKEELRSGRSLSIAIERGFDRAWSSIRDSNISTLITCAILIWFGEQFNADLVRGFAITLGIGVILSMFSAIIVTRTLLRSLVGFGLERHLWLFAGDLQAVKRERARKPFMFDFVRRRGFFFALSAIILIPGVISLLIPPALEPGIEFTSGATMTLDFVDESLTQDDVSDALADAGHGEARVQRTSDGTYIIRMDELQTPPSPPIGPTPPSERDSLQLSLEASLGAFTVLNFNQVSEIVSNEIVVSAAIAVLFASLAILAYISWTFRNVPKSYRYGIAALVAAGHDVLFVIGAFSIFGKVFGTEVDSMFITGVLTVLGFSVHDTIVVFDRIRENVTTNPGVAYDEIVNASLTETLARSLNTSITVIFTILALLLLGAGEINVLLLTLLLGIIAGTYSSIFIASQILVSWEYGDFGRILRRLTPWRKTEEPATASA